MSKGKNRPVYIPIVNTYFNNGVKIRQDLSAVVSTAYRSKGVGYKGYRLQIARAGSASTALNGYTETFTQSNWSTESGSRPGSTGPYIYKYTSSGGTLLSGPRINTIGALGYVKARAATAFLADAHSALRGFDSGTFIGELSETVRMIRNPIKAISDYSVRHCRSVRNKLKGVSSRKARNKLVHDTYLQYVYGVKPLLNDIDDAMRTAAELSVGIQTKRCKGEYHDSVVEYDATISTPANLHYQPDNLRLKIRSTSTHSCRIIGAVKLTNPNSGIVGGNKKLGERLGASLDNFIPTIYNLIPFSFVIDYFSNVGEVIDAMSAYNVDFAWSNTTYHIELETNAHIVTSGSATANTRGSYNGGDYRYTGTSFDRGGGVPIISYESVHFKVPTLTQGLNLANLIGSLNAARHI